MSDAGVWFVDPSRIDTGLDSRSVTFENPTAARGAGGRERGGRKGAPSRPLEPGERVVLADVEGPGTIRHVWMTFPPAPPEVMRAVWMEVFYDGGAEPSVSLPCLDFFGLPHGRPVAYASALTSVHEGRGFNAYFPMPFRRAVRVELTNGSARAQDLYYQLDLTLERHLPPAAGYLHASFRRENPTVMGRDFVIAEGLAGPGRFVGCVVGVRVLDEGMWYGEGEVKIYRDGDRAHPTICGTGLEDHVGSAWGMGPHAAPLAGAPLEVRPPDSAQPDLVGFYRWHLPDPIVLTSDLRVTIQQIGMALFADSDEAGFSAFAATHPAAGRGWLEKPRAGVRAMGIHERVDVYSAAAFVSCLEPQAVPRLDVAGALAGIERRPYEHPHPFEGFLTP